jgi:hypothetical protein
VGKVDPASWLPGESLQRQFGPRRTLLVAATALAAIIEREILLAAPSEIRRFDPLLRPEFMLAALLDDPVHRSRMRVLEGPYERLRARVRVAALPVAPTSAPASQPAK